VGDGWGVAPVIVKLTDKIESSPDQFDVFSVRGRPVLAISARNRHFRAAAARRFPLFSTKRRFFRRTLQAAIALRLDFAWSRRRRIPEALVGNFDFQAWMQFIRETLGRSDLFPVVHGPPQRERKRAYVHFLDASGQPVAFAKIAFDEFNNAQLEREAQIHSILRDSAPRRFKTPLMLAHGLFNRDRFILFEPLPIVMAPVKIPWELLRPAAHEIAGPLRILPRQIVLESDWWNRLLRRTDVSPQFVNELESLMADGLPACLVHGDLGVNNLVVSGEVLWIIDWEQGCEAAPFRTDEISYYLSVHQQQVNSRPRIAIGEFARKFLDDNSPETWRDVVAALAFLAATGLESAQKIVANWDLTLAAESSADRAGSAARAGIGASSHIAIISNEPTPYRLHVLRRLYAELGGVCVHNIFTHTVSSPSMPWQMRIEPKLNPVFFPKHHLTMDRPVSKWSVPLFGDLKKYILSRKIQMIILLGYNDLTRLLLIRWAKRAAIPVILTGDSNIFADAQTPLFTRFFKGFVLRWVLRHVSALMPMGTCGRAFFRRYIDHDLPEFLFPYEPDYAALDSPDPIRLNRFRLKHGLTANRKRLLYCGRLIQVKRVDMLLRAFISIAQARPEWDLVIVGQGPLREDLESLIPDHLRERVKWLGFLQADEVVLAYHSCEVLVHPAEFEPWGLVINEATACHLPIITTSVVGAAVELVQHNSNGLIVAPGSIETLAGAIFTITRSDCYLRMRGWCDASLDRWRKTADPVNAVQAAMRHFGLHWTPSPKVASTHRDGSADWNDDVANDKIRKSV
jgi:glycosyltransferase involved in cell wall biosynthesis